MGSSSLCGASGRAWLLKQELPEDERLAVERHLREFDRLADDLKVIERDLARSALVDEGVKRLMTIPGIDMVVALAIVAAIGEVGRFDRPQKLVSYLGLNPSVRQSGPGPAYHGRITKQGRGVRRPDGLHAQMAEADRLGEPARRPMRAAGGFSLSVMLTTCSIAAAVRGGLRPGRVASRSSPATPRAR